MFQAPGWSTVSSTRGGFNFQFPNGTYIQKDTLSTLYYGRSIDTLLSLNVHYIDDVYTVQNDSLWGVLLNQNNGDTLRAVGTLMLILTNGQLLSIQNLSPTNTTPQGLEIGISLATDQTGAGFIFSRIYYHGGRFTAFTASSIDSDILRLGSYKTTFFNSINFY